MTDDLKRVVRDAVEEHGHWEMRAHWRIVGLAVALLAAVVVLILVLVEFDDDLNENRRLLVETQAIVCESMGQLASVSEQIVVPEACSG